MPVVIPTAVVADGKLAVLWVPTGGIADVDAPTSAELVAGTVTNITGWLTADGFTPSADEQTVADERLSTTQSFSAPGRYSQGLKIKYVYDQQAPPGDAENVVYETFKRGVQGYIVTRAGLAFDTAFTDGDVVDVWPVTCGVQSKISPDANTVLRVEQTLHVRNAVETDVVVGGAS
jgi:hypothetical protein